MKKIVLIDDNKRNQREVYSASFVEDITWNEILFHVEKLNDKSDFSFLSNAVCVMMHDSLEDFINGEFVSSSHKAKEIIEGIIYQKGIPYVLFSDGHPMIAEWREETPDIVYSIKKTEFYGHLFDFLSNYKETGRIDMRIIAYGKDYLRLLMCKWCQTIISNISNLKDNDTIEIQCVDRKSLRQIIENSQPRIGISFDTLMCDLEDGIISASQLRNNLNSIISNYKKYGKNISPWQ